VLRKVKGQKGFTLIEVIVSLVIAGVLVVALYTLLYHLNLTLEQEELLRATMIAKEKIMEGPLDKEAGRFEPPYDGFYYRQVIIDTPFPGIKLLRLTVTATSDVTLANPGKNKELITMERLIRVNK
jgi:prepilin-type N-terminal cleavage/methylation domain-containing protein